MFKTRLKLIVFFVLLMLVFSCKEKECRQYPFTNDLIHETSPYLLQHANNPVNWRPWSQEALNLAKKENKLVLLSVGYSSCHWCHVMEDETFEDVEVAKLMNTNFINIKVDREERPDIDQIYMTALQLIKGQGGWPMNMIILPNGKPIYGGTYYTKAQWIEVLSTINAKYQTNPIETLAYADKLAKGIEEVNDIQPANNTDILTRNRLENIISEWKTIWDTEWGGNMGNQKFMLPVNLNFLIDYAQITKDYQIKAFVKTTLDKMMTGGIYDHIGGGFFRYSTDVHWKIPHFEKMLYDNAQLVSLYSKAYLVFKDEDYKQVVEETLVFLDREMYNGQGGYYAALDADSEGIEGKFYAWEKEELKSLLKDEFSLFQDLYGIHHEEVWEEDKYIIHQTQNKNNFAQQNYLSKADLDSRIFRWKTLILKARNQRVTPRKDDKIITSWNALLVSGFIDAYKAFGNEKYLKSAVSTFAFILKMGNEDSVVHSYKKGGKFQKGFLDDYAFLANAALDIYKANLDTKYLDIAIELNMKIENAFYDSGSGLYVYNVKKDLISKSLKIDDGVLPSPNAMMAHNLFQLGHILYEVSWLEKSKNMLSSVVPYIEGSPSSYARWNSLWMNIAYPFYEIAVVGKKANRLVADLNSYNLPNSLTIGSVETSELPLFESRYAENDTFIYVCKQTTCKLPVRTVEEAIGQLDAIDFSSF